MNTSLGQKTKRFDVLSDTKYVDEFLYFSIKPDCKKAQNEPNKQCYSRVVSLHVPGYLEVNVFGTEDGFTGSMLGDSFDVESSLLNL